MCSTSGCACRIRMVSSSNRNVASLSQLPAQMPPESSVRVLLQSQRPSAIPLSARYECRINGFAAGNPAAGLPRSSVCSTAGARIGKASETGIQSAQSSPRGLPVTSHQILQVLVMARTCLRRRILGQVEKLTAAAENASRYPSAMSSGGSTPSTSLTGLQSYLTRITPKRDVTA